ncbi:MAG: S8 family serine peptidase [Acidobacteria bacterium]|nr:S8 family serine peptidase [Acidobacteriota bacterium]MBV9184913.1 S8 family serine peptidase [Acidobacteriota bacterium]
MKKILALSLFLVPSLFAAETHRYLVATTHASHLTNLRVLSAGEVTARNVRTFDAIDGFAVDLTDAEAAEMRKSAGVRYVSRTIAIHSADSVAPPRLAPHAEGPPLAAKQVIPPNIDLLHARDVWPLTRGGNVNIAIIDTGIDVGHADLVENIAGGYNTFTKQGDFNDDNQHGTHVAGIIGALDNNIGVVGVAPGARMYAVKVLDAEGNGTDENLVAAADWVMASKHAKGGNWIMSMSLGSHELSPPVEEAFQRLVADGVLCIAAAGNDGGFYDMLYPAALPGVVSVGAVDNDKVRADFSDIGPTLNVVAPGVSILSTLPTRSIKRGVITVGDGTVVPSAMVTGTRLGDVTGEWVSCGYGAAGDFPPETRGRIAVMSRGMSLTFSEKVRNARAAGAIGAVIFNSNLTTITTWTLITTICDGDVCYDNPSDLAYDWPVVVSMSNADGLKLLANAKQQTLTLSTYLDDYGTLSGTSMATPHVTGVAALAWSLAPSATAKQVAAALRSSATDLGPLGVDNYYGFGIVDALGTAKWLAPAAFALPARPDIRTRGAHH